MRRRTGVQTGANYNILRQIRPNIDTRNLVNSVSCVINSNRAIWTNPVTDQYSFSNSADTRFVSFANILNSSDEMINYRNLFQEYRIVSASVLVCQTNIASFDDTSTYQALYITCSPSTVTPANPTNSVQISSDNAKIISPILVKPMAVAFKFPGIGATTNQWLATTTGPNGAFYIGSQPTIFSHGTVAQPYYDCIFSITVQYRGSKSN